MGRFCFFSKPLSYLGSEFQFFDEVFIIGHLSYSTILPNYVNYTIKGYLWREPKERKIQTTPKMSYSVAIVVVVVVVVVRDLQLLRRV